MVTSPVTLRKRHRPVVVRPNQDHVRMVHLATPAAAEHVNMRRQRDAYTLT